LQVAETRGSRARRWRMSDAPRPEQADLDADDLRRRAEHWRQLARAINDERAAVALIDLASEYEARAAAAERE